MGWKEVVEHNGEHGQIIEREKEGQVGKRGKALIGKNPDSAGGRIFTWTPGVYADAGALPTLSFIIPIIIIINITRFDNLLLALYKFMVEIGAACTHCFGPMSEFSRRKLVAPYRLTGLGPAQYIGIKWCCNLGLDEGEETELIEMQDAATKREDRELKEKLVRMYGSHIRSLKLEFSKKKKKGKLPKEGRQTLLAWWNLHSKWPYPTVCSLSPSTLLTSRYYLIGFLFF